MLLLPSQHLASMVLFGNFVNSARLLLIKFSLAKSQQEKHAVKNQFAKVIEDLFAPLH